MPRRSRKRARDLKEDAVPTLTQGALQRLHNGQYSHVAQAYLDNGSGETAASLTSKLRPWARARVLATGHPA